MLLPLEGSEPGLCFASLKERRVQMCQDCHRHQHSTKPFSVTELEGLRETGAFSIIFPIKLFNLSASHTSVNSVEPNRIMFFIRGRIPVTL